MATTGCAYVTKDAIRALGIRPDGDWTGEARRRFLEPLALVEEMNLPYRLPMAIEPQPPENRPVETRSFVKRLDWRARTDKTSQEDHARFETAVRRVMEASDVTAQKVQHEEVFQLFLRLLSEIQASIVKSEEKRRQSRIWGRALVSVSSLAAALAGLGLALNYHGFGSRAFGIAAAVVGTWATISTSLRLDEEHERNTRRNRFYKRLLREVQLYLVSSFATVTADQAASRFVKFSREYERIDPPEGESSGGGRGSGPA